MDCGLILKKKRDSFAKRAWLTGIDPVDSGQTRSGPLVLDLTVWVWLGLNLIRSIGSRSDSSSEKERRAVVGDAGGERARRRTAGISPGLPFWHSGARFDLGLGQEACARARELVGALRRWPRRPEPGAQRRPAELELRRAVPGEGGREGGSKGGGELSHLDVNLLGKTKETGRRRNGVAARSSELEL